MKVKIIESKTIELNEQQLKELLSGVDLKNLKLDGVWMGKGKHKKIVLYFKGE